MSTPNDTTALSSLHNSNGSIMLGALSLIVLVSVVGASSFRYVDAYQTHNSSNSLRMSRDLVETKLRNYARSRDVVFASIDAAGNGVYRACLIDDTAAGGSDLGSVCSTPNPVGLNLAYPSSANVIVSGNPNAPSTFNLDGTACVPSADNGKCTKRVLQVSSRFKAVCADGSTSCALVRGINFEFEIVPSNDVAEVGRSTVSYYHNLKDALMVAINEAPTPEEPIPPPPPPPSPPPILGGGGGGGTTGGGGGEELPINDDDKYVDTTGDDAVDNSDRIKACKAGQSALRGGCHSFNL